MKIMILNEQPFATGISGLVKAAVKCMELPLLTLIPVTPLNTDFTQSEEDTHGNYCRP